MYVKKMVQSWAAKTCQKCKLLWRRKSVTPPRNHICVHSVKYDLVSHSSVDPIRYWIFHCAQSDVYSSKCGGKMVNMTCDGEAAADIKAKYDFAQGPSSQDQHFGWRVLAPRGADYYTGEYSFIQDLFLCGILSAVVWCGQTSNDEIIILTFFPSLHQRTLEKILGSSMTNYASCFQRHQRHGKAHIHPQLLRELQWGSRTTTISYHQFDNSQF